MPSHIPPHCNHSSISSTLSKTSPRLISSDNTSKPHGTSIPSKHSNSSSSSVTCETGKVVAKNFTLPRNGSSSPIQRRSNTTSSSSVHDLDTGRIFCNSLSANTWGKRDSPKNAPRQRQTKTSSIRVTELNVSKPSSLNTR